MRSIEHGTYVDDDTLRLMKERGTFLVPTLAIMSALGDPRGDGAEAIALQVRTHHMMKPLREVVRKAKALGIVIAASTDGSYGDGDDTARVRVAHDIEELVGCGFTPLEAITAATRDGARVLGIEARTGTVAVGPGGGSAGRRPQPPDRFDDLVRADARGHRRPRRREPAGPLSSSNSASMRPWFVRRRAL